MSAAGLSKRALLLGLVVALMPVAACRRPEPEVHRESRPLMGTVVDVAVEGRDIRALREATEAAYREMNRLSDMMNHYDPRSVVSEVNRQAGVRPVRVPPELMQVLQMAERVSRRTHGAFDITVGSLKGWSFNPEHPAIPSPRQIQEQLPLVNYRNVVLDPGAATVFLRRRGMRIDLGGIAKLYILHAGMEILERRGIAHAMINGGGDVEVLGTVHGRPWRIGVRDPRRPEGVFAVIELTHGFVVSSGDYERYFIKDKVRYHHILDPKTGYPTHGPRQVTLVADDLDTVNGLSAAVMVLGMHEGQALIEHTPGLEGLIVGRDGQLWMTPGLEKRLKLLRSP